MNTNLANTKATKNMVTLKNILQTSLNTNSSIDNTNKQIKGTSLTFSA